MSGDAQARERMERVLRLWEQVEALGGRRAVDDTDVIALVMAVRVLDERPRAAQAARVAMHDVSCIGGAGCGSRGEHARTWTRTVAALRAALAVESKQ